MPEHDPRRELIAASKSALARLRSAEEHYRRRMMPEDVDPLRADIARLAAAIEAMEAKTAEPAQQLRTCCIGCGTPFTGSGNLCPPCVNGRAREFDHHTGLSRP